MASIVAVNDDPEFLSLIDDLLTDQGHLVHTEIVGDRAFESIRRRQPDLVILDMRLGHPEGGWMILDRMRLDAQTAHIPAIICSADDRFLQTHAQHLQEEGSCLLLKPFAVPDLLALLAKALAPASTSCRRSSPA